MSKYHLSERWFDEVSYWKENPLLLNYDSSELEEKRVEEASKPLVNRPVVEWAKTYWAFVKSSEKQTNKESDASSTDYRLLDTLRSKITEKIKENLAILCQLAWSNVENLLGEGKEYHFVSEDLLQPPKFITQSFLSYTKIIDAFANYKSPTCLSEIVGGDLMAIRKKCCQEEPLVLAFMVMQFYSVSKNILGFLSTDERLVFAPYLQVVTDYLYLPIGDLDSLMKNYESNSPILIGVQHLIGQINPISQAVYERIICIHSKYRSRNGMLKEAEIRRSSMRDIKMFLLYLCLCALEGNMRPLQQELFPLCVMLYPKLHVSWQLVQDLLLVLFWQVSERLDDQDIVIFLPYLRTMNKIFSDEVLNG
jgi:hypothetical protein